MQIRGFQQLEVVMFSDSTNGAGLQIGVSQWCAIQTVCCDRILCCEEIPVGNIHSHLSTVYGSAVTDRSTVGCWVKRMMASETGEAELKQSCMVCLAILKQYEPWSAAVCWCHQSQELTLQNPTAGISVFQSVKEVLVTLYVILDIRKCVQDGFLGASQLNIKLREMQFLLYYCQMLKLKWRPPYPWFLQ